jgi:hypothetical protein
MADYQLPQDGNQSGFVTPEAPFKLDIKSATIKGVYIGVFSILLFVALYAAGIQYLSNPMYSLMILFPPLGLLIYLGIQERKVVYGGYLEYMQAYQVLLVMCIVSSVVYQLFSVLMFKVVDPELATKMADGVIEFTKSMMPDGADQDQMDEVYDKTRSDLMEQLSFSPLQILYSLSKVIVGYAVFNFILALFVRRKREMFS